MTTKELADAILSGRPVGMLDEAETFLVLGEIQDRCRKAPSSAGEAGKLTADLASATQRAEKAESELASLRAENAKLKAESANIEERIHLKAAQELCRIGIREFVPSAATAATAKAPTVTEQCVAAMASGASSPTTSSAVPVPTSAQFDDDGEE